MSIWILAGIVFVVAFTTGAVFGVFAMRDDAIRHGVAGYYIDDKGVRRFGWLKGGGI